jgi:hypothetical protein
MSAKINIVNLSDLIKVDNWSATFWTLDSINEFILSPAYVGRLISKEMYKSIIFI